MKYKAKSHRIKKPIYKRWWFITLILFTIIGALGGEDVVCQAKLTPFYVEI